MNFVIICVFKLCTISFKFNIMLNIIYYKSKFPRTITEISSIPPFLTATTPISISARFLMLFRGFRNSFSRILTLSVFTILDAVRIHKTSWFVTV